MLFRHFITTSLLNTARIYAVLLGDSISVPDVLVFVFHYIMGLLVISHIFVVRLGLWCSILVSQPYGPPSVLPLLGFYSTILDFTFLWHLDIPFHITLAYLGIFRLFHLGFFSFFYSRHLADKVGLHFPYRSYCSLPYFSRDFFTSFVLTFIHLTGGP